MEKESHNSDNLEKIAPKRIRRHNVISNDQFFKLVAYARYLLQKDTLSNTPEQCLESFDLIQEAFIKVYKNGNNLPANPEHAFYYLKRSIKHAFIDHIRKEQKEEEKVQFSPLEENEMWGVKMMAKVNISKNNLPLIDHLHNIIVRKQFLTEKEMELWVQIYTLAPNRMIAERMRTSEKTIKTARHRLFKKIRKHITREELYR